jgi:hypothetical protein
LDVGSAIGNGLTIVGEPGLGAVINGAR